MGIALQHSFIMRGSYDPFSFPPNLLFLIFWKDRYGGFLATKKSATTPFYCLKFAPFCERHSFLCIVAVC